MRSGTAARAGLQDRAELARMHRTLVARLDLIDTLSNRLSHVIDEYDKKTITGVRINAILADSQQHLPLLVQRLLTGEATLRMRIGSRKKRGALFLVHHLLSPILYHSHVLYLSPSPHLLCSSPPFLLSLVTIKHKPHANKLWAYGEQFTTDMFGQVCLYFYFIFILFY
jgi:hypothetical protein